MNKVFIYLLILVVGVAAVVLPIAYDVSGAIGGIAITVGVFMVIIGILGICLRKRGLGTIIEVFFEIIGHF